MGMAYSLAGNSSPSQPCMRSFAPALALFHMCCQWSSARLQLDLGVAATQRIAMSGTPNWWEVREIPRNLVYTEKMEQLLQNRKACDIVTNDPMISLFSRHKQPCSLATRPSI